MTITYDKETFYPPTSSIQFTVIDWDTRNGVMFWYHPEFPASKESFNTVIDKLKEFVFSDFSKQNTRQFELPSGLCELTDKPCIRAKNCTNCIVALELENNYPV